MSDPNLRPRRATRCPASTEERGNIEHCPRGPGGPFAAPFQAAMPPCRMAVYTKRPPRTRSPPLREGRERERERERRRRGRSWSKQAAPTWTRCLTLDSAFPKIPDNRLANPSSSWHFSFGGFLGRRSPRGQPLVFSILSLPLHSHKPSMGAPAKTDLVTASPSWPFPSQPTHLRSSAALTPPHRISLFQVVLRETCDRVEQERRVNSPATTISTLARYSDQARPSNPS